MIETLKTKRVETLDQVRAFVDSSEPVDIAVTDRTRIYRLLRRTLVRLPELTVLLQSELLRMWDFLRLKDRELFRWQ